MLTLFSDQSSLYNDIIQLLVKHQNYKKCRNIKYNSTIPLAKEIKSVYIKL